MCPAAAKDTGINTSTKREEHPKHKEADKEVVLKSKTDAGGTIYV
jgi:hypothetical protein